MNQSQKRFIVIISAVILAVLFLVWFFQARHAGQTRINIVVSPTDSTVLIDGQPGEAGSVWLENGEHTLKASREFFTDVTVNINTEEIESGQDVFLMAGADSPEAEAWLLDHPEEQMAREGAGGALAAQRSKILNEKFPIVNKLPYDAFDYKIDYGFESDDQIFFVITVTVTAVAPGTPEYDQEVGLYKARALDYLRANGIDVKTADIEYKIDSKL